MYKVFINESVINFLEKTENVAENSREYLGQEQMLNIITSLEAEDGSKTYNMLCDNPNEAWDSFCSIYALIEAAGGVVQNELGKLLMIFRLGKWDLPKGKIEKGENPQEAGMREVTEECGVNGLTIKSELPSSFHTYRHNGKRVLKKTYWYMMHCKGDNKLVPQTEEDILQVVWANRADVKENLKNTYSSIAWVLEQV